MIGFDVPEEVFPPVGVLERLLAWYSARPDAAGSLLKGAEEFFGDPEGLPDEADEERMPEVVRFLEWLLLDRPLDGADEPPAVAFAREATGAKRVGIPAILGSRHDIWRVVETTDSRVLLRPLGGGPDLTVEHPGLAGDASVGEALVGRFYPWNGGWVPSLALFFIPDPGQDPGTIPPLEALMAQQLFFSSAADEGLDPAEARAEIIRLLALFELKLSIDDLALMAAAAGDARTFLEGFMALAEERLAEERLAEALLEEHLKDWRRMGPLLVNFWQHAPRAELGGQSYGDLARVAEAEARQGVEKAIEAVFEAIETEDAPAFEALLDPDGELALVFDLWGWAGVHLLTDWGAPTGSRSLLGVEEDLGALATEVAWQHASGPRGATLWFIEHAESFLLTEAVAEVGSENIVSPEYARAQERGIALPWRAETADPVERKLRNSLFARKLPLLDQATMIKAWRLMAANEPLRDVSAPEAWAAAVEAYFRHSLGQEVSLNQVSDFYGAKKTLVKQRFAVLEAQLNQASERARG